MTELSHPHLHPSRLHTLWVAAVCAALFTSCGAGGGAVETSGIPDPGGGGSSGGGSSGGGSGGGTGGGSGGGGSNGGGGGSNEPTGVELTPLNGLLVAGSVDGVFFPTETTYSLENHHSQTTSWSVQLSANWLQVDGPTEGTLAPGATVTVPFELDTSVVNNLTPGSYPGTIEFEISAEPTPLTRDVTLTVSPAQANANSTVGINLSPMTYHSTNWPFVDIFKASRPWTLQVSGSSSSEPVQLTDDGWVASLNANEQAITYMFVSAGENYPGGQYSVFYNGEGTLDFGMDATVLSSSPGSMILDVQPSNGILLRQTSTNPANPLRDIRIVMPGFENTYQSEPFHPLFLERLSKYRTLRFMDWGKTNNSELMHWADRTRPESAQQTVSSGVALEYMIQLSNTLHANPWICIPHLADDDYITQCATLIRDQLDPTLVCHIEFSNEVWNWGFQQAGYASQQGLILYPSAGLETSRHLYYSDRSVNVFNIFEDVFGPANMSRVRRVLAGQRGSTSAHTSALSHNDAYLKTDAYSIAMYFGNGLVGNVSAAEVATWSVDDMLDWCEESLSNNLNLAANTVALAASFGLPTITYEGGQHLVGYTDPVIRATYDAANRHPRMKTIYLTMLNGWQGAGGDLFTAFNSIMRYSGTGRWGVLEYQTQPRLEAPKYDALMQFIEM